MTKSEVIKDFKSVCTKDGVTDYVWLFILCGLPFGIPRMFAWIVPGGSLGTALPLFLLNFIIGGVIGGFVLVWRLLVPGLATAGGCLVYSLDHLSPMGLCKESPHAKERVL